MPPPIVNIGQNSGHRHSRSLRNQRSRTQRSRDPHMRIQDGSPVAGRLRRVRRPRRLTRSSDSSSSAAAVQSESDGTSDSNVADAISDLDNPAHEHGRDDAEQSVTTHGPNASIAEGAKIYVVLHQQLEPDEDDVTALDSNYAVESVGAYLDVGRANEEAWLVAINRHPDFAILGRIRPRTTVDDTDVIKSLEWSQDEDGTLEIWCCSSGIKVDYKVWVSQVPLGSG